jgi:uncharacterized protein YndB with AHSA1/START domain
MLAMKKLHFTTTINAPRQRVWDVMLQPETYREWTAEFAPGSYYEGSWDKGARIKFLGPSGDGISSIIADNRRHEFISIQHLREIKEGVEHTSATTESWAGALENYTFRDAAGGTELRVDTDTTEDFADDLGRMWPKALARLKALCEQS